MVQLTRRRRLFAGAVFVVVVTAALPAPRLAHSHEGHAALPSKGLTVDGNQLLLSEGARLAIDLATAKVSLASLGRTIECNARIELPWGQQALVTTQIPGRITEVLVRPGDAVEAGQPLAHLESLELESLQLTMLQADAELSLARDQYQRRSSLASQGVIAGRAAFDAEASVKQKTTELQIALCKLRAVGLEQSVLDDVRASRRPLDRFAIVSPIAGTVAEADVRVGQQVKTTEHLFHVVNLARVWAIGSVLEGDLADVAAGQPAHVTFTAMPERSFAGAVDHLRLKIDASRRTRAAVMELDNSDGTLRPGMFGRMAIQVAESREAVVCPRDALIRPGTRQDRLPAARVESHFVLLQRGDGKYVRQLVRLGLRDREQVEILDGLFPGDQVVITGNHVLFSLFGRTENGDDAPADVHSPGAEPDQAPPPHTTSSQQTHSDVMVAQGVVELPTDRKVFAGSRIEGRIGRILVRHSQPVEVGQVLAEIDSLELRNVQGTLLETETRLDWTSRRIGQIADLAEQSITSRNELWQLETDERVLSAKRDSLLRTLALIGVSDSQADRLRAMDLSTDDCNSAFVRSVPIRAAIDGAVADFDVVPGQVVDGQSTLFEIHDTSTLWVRGHVFQQDALRIELGQPVRLTFTADPGAVVTGKVVRLSPVLNSSERVLPLWVEVDNAEGRLIEGMWARMEIGQTGEAVD